MKKLIFLFLLVFLCGCADQVEQSTVDWKNIELKDINTGNTFKISDFNNPILVESFAVWCPTCRKQQDELKKLHEELPEVVSISLDTDPNEDEVKVLEHAIKHGFDWLYAVSPVDLTKLLIDEFGFTVVNAPSAPVVLVCGDGEARLLPRGVKDVDELKEEIERC